MEGTQCTQEDFNIRRLVHDATSGEYHDGVRLKYIQEVKRIGKVSHGSIRVLFDAILLTLQAPDCRVRIAALELWHVLFDRSALFRKLGCCKLDVFLGCVVGKRRVGRWELPGPSGAAEELRRQGLGLVQKWNAAYGHVLPRLRLGYRYLKNAPDVVFPDEPSGASSMREDALPAAVEQALEEFSGREDQWKMLVTELENARVVLDTVPLESSREEEKEDDDEDWEDVDPPPVTRDDAVCVQLLDSYREASSQSISHLQRIIGVCRDYVEREVVREMMDRAVEINAALVSECAAYERKVGAKAREAQERSKRKEKMTRPSTSERVSSSRMAETNRMQHIKDPAAPRAPRPVKKQSVPAPSKQTSHVLAKLAAVAPVVPASGFARVWDSDAPPVYAGSHSMEVSNHWGPVDVHQELPKDRLDALFLIDQSKVQYKKNDSLENTRQQPKTARRHPHTLMEGRQSHTMTESTQLSTIQRSVLDASSNLENRRAERTYNEDILREANMGHLSALDDLPQRMGQSTEDATAQQPRRNASSKRKISVHERLAKKLCIKKT